MPLFDVEYTAVARVDADTAEDAEFFVNNDLNETNPDEYQIVDVREVKQED